MASLGKVTWTVPDSTNEKNRLLGDDRQLAPQVLQTNVSDVDIINDD